MARYMLGRMGGTSGFGSGSRLLEWWSSGRAEVFQLGSAAESCKKVRSCAGAYIVGVVYHPYLATWLPLWLTIPSYTSTTSVVLAVRHASTGKGVGLTCVKSIVRPLGIQPYMCQVDRTTIGAPIPASDQLPASGRPRRRASCPRKRGCGGQVIMCHIILPPREDLLEVPDEGAKNEVLCLAADSRWL
ncbi:hypothetical protein GW17_00038523 [Ensete ventricosum]|nr:hypothetical protein GW17_00038523 [Ensete ventricosum]